MLNLYVSPQFCSTATHDCNCTQYVILYCDSLCTIYFYVDVNHPWMGLTQHIFRLNAFPKSSFVLAQIILFVSNTDKYYLPFVPFTNVNDKTA